MPWYKCFIEGTNFPIAIDGEPGLVGFFTTRFVEAMDEHDAEFKALALLRAEKSLQLSPGTPRPADARVDFTEIEEIAASDVPDPQPGLVFFGMDT